MVVAPLDCASSARLHHFLGTICFRLAQMTPRTRARIGLYGLGLLGWLAFAVMAWATTQPYRPFYPSDNVVRPAPLPYALPLIYAAWVIYYCDETGVPVWLACRLFARESEWNPRAKYANDNGSVDQGIAQLNSGSLDIFARLYNKGATIDPLDPETSIRVGISYLAALYAELKDWRAAVGAYNCGLARWRTGRVPERTRAHVRAVMGGEK